MKLHNVIGGLEEKVEGITLRGKPFIELNANKAHNQLCNREVEIVKKKMNELFMEAHMLGQNDAGCKHASAYNGLADCIRLTEALSKAIEQGKVLKVDIGGRE